MSDIIYMISPFPPPVRGMPLVSQTIYNFLQSNGFEVVKLDISHSARINSTLHPIYAFFLKFLRIKRLIKAWLQILIRGRKQVLYMTLSGSAGQVWDAVTIVLARVLQMKIIVHHHSSAYLLHKNWLTGIVLGLSGRYAVHIVLCEDMKRKMRELYSIEQVIRLSNRFMFPDDSSINAHNTLQTIGYLSNITRAKGGERIVELAEKISQQKLGIRVVVAGPCLDPYLHNKIVSAQQSGYLEYRGPVYGRAKQEFWQEVDAFVFPTEYTNEAEPLVVWEALEYGIPVIANNRGCIAEQLQGTGYLASNPETFVDEAFQVLKQWRENPDLYQMVRESALNRFVEAKIDNRQQLDKIVEFISR
ncbi:MAG: glycosyltransferase family 1 protein [Methanobacteriota archaeon]|nr:MAG: glycosyltransferase family 1 protein [Euryarchaeota archaeon]